MYCPKCGASVADGSQHCPVCGTAVAAQQGAAQQAQPGVNQNMNYGAGAAQQAQPGFNGAAPFNGGQPPLRPTLKTDRNVVLYILLSAITCGIYGLITMGGIVDDVNTVCRPYDGKKTTNYYLMVFVLSWLTLGIYPIIWMHGLCARMGDNLKQRGIDYNFGAGTFWGWCVLGSLIIVGPIVFIVKLFAASNKLNADYNFRG